MYFCGQKCVKKGWPAHRDFCKRHRGICERLEKLVSLLSPDADGNGNPADEIFFDAVKTFMAKQMSKVDNDLRGGFAKSMQVLYAALCLYELGGANSVGMLKSFAPVLEDEGFIGSNLASHVMAKDYPPLPSMQSNKDAQVVELCDILIENYLNEKELERTTEAGR